MPRDADPKGSNGNRTPDDRQRRRERNRVIGIVAGFAAVLLLPLAVIVARVLLN